MAESPAQNAVCVIGHPIGGNPSQFCITRVFDDWELDWQCLSFDVAPESLAAALLGIEALGFVGALIASPHEAAAAQRLGAQSSLAQASPGCASSAASAVPIATIAQSQLPSADALDAPGPVAADPLAAATAPSAAFRWIDGLRREPGGSLVGCNFLAEAVDDLLREHQQRTGQPLVACLLLGDLAALESATLPFASCLPPLRYQLTADGSLVLRGGSQTSVKAAVGPAVTLEALTGPLLVIRMPEQPLKSKGKAAPRDDHAGQGSLPRGLHPDSLVFELAGDFSPTALPPGPGQRLPRSVTPLDLEIARLVAAIRGWTGQVADRTLLAEAIEEYLEI